MLKHVQVLTSTGDQHIDAMSKVCVTDYVALHAFAAQEVGFDNLCEIVDGTPRVFDTLINHVLGMVFPFDRT